MEVVIKRRTDALVRRKKVRINQTKVSPHMLSRQVMT